MTALSSKGRFPVSVPQHVHWQDHGGVHVHAQMSSVATAWASTVARVSAGSASLGPNAGLPVLSALTAVPIALARRSRRQALQRVKTGVARQGVEDSGKEQRGQWEMISNVTSANDSDELDGFIVPSRRKARNTKSSTSSSSSSPTAPSRPVRQAAVPTSNGTHRPEAPVEQSSRNDDPTAGSPADNAVGGGGWWKPVAGGQAAATKSQRSLDSEKEVSVSDFADNAGTPLMRKGVRVKMAKSNTSDDADDATDDSVESDEDELASFINPSARSGRNRSPKRRPTRRPRTAAAPAIKAKPAAEELATSAMTQEMQLPASEPSSSSNAPPPEQGWWRPVDGGYGRAAKSQRTLNLEKEVSISDFADNVDPLIIQSRRNSEMTQPASKSVKANAAVTPALDNKEEELQHPTEAELNGLPNLLMMTEIERADLVDAHTREAMKLLEEGKEKEAMATFDRMNRIVALFQKVAAPDENADKEAKSVQAKLAEEVHQGDVDEIYLKWRQELHEDDFSEIFGSKAWNSRWIGGIL
mmetsp:Transcript_41645/g.75583  ORF Transcript_41645/g.75583 Transcript_41645/m.75583 type:complete len:528 (-) Transcript_41645:128-1711(-)